MAFTCSSGLSPEVIEDFFVAAGPIALLLVAAAFLLQPVAVRLVSVFKREPPTQVNYTQAWVQGAVVLPMLATGSFVAAILWNQSVNVRESAALEAYGALFRTMWRYWPFPLSCSIWLLSLCGVVSEGAGSSSRCFHFARPACCCARSCCSTRVPWILCRSHRAFVFTHARPVHSR
jgi:hypothetical protein